MALSGQNGLLISGYTPLKAFTMVGNNLVPELSVSNLENSLKFYCDILGFKIEFERAEDRFAYLSFHGSELMLEEDSGRQSPWNILPFDYPRGRGLNLSINCPDVDALVAKLHEARVPLQKEAENCWYRDNDILRGQRNFLSGRLSAPICAETWHQARGRVGPWCITMRCSGCSLSLAPESFPLYGPSMER